MNNGWRSLLSKEWADCVLHNLPICVSTTSPDLILEKQFSFAVQKTPKADKMISSFYELSKSAAGWDYFDITEKSGRCP